MDHIADRDLVAQFEAVRLPPAEFRHREHVRVAFALLADTGELAAAALRFKRGLLALGAGAKYHETLTWAYLTVIHERMHRGAYASSVELLARNRDLLDHHGGAIAAYYDVAAITACPIARRVFVLPRGGWR